MHIRIVETEGWARSNARIRSGIPLPAGRFHPSERGAVLPASIGDDGHPATFEPLAHWPDGATAPELSYEPVGLIDLPPGDRGYGKGDRIDSEVSLEAYNAEVETRQREAGSLPTAEPLGARMKWEAWREVENPTPITPERSK